MHRTGKPPVRCVAGLCSIATDSPSAKAIRVSGACADFFASGDADRALKPTQSDPLPF